jgi:MFS family permease
MPERPNNGIDSPRAWLIVVAAFFVAFAGFGVTYTFGVFLRPIATSFGAGHAAMSAIFSTLTVLSFFVAPLTGDLADRIGPRYVVGAGALLMGSGLLLSARVHSFALLFVTYGVFVGAGMAFIYIPSIAAVGEWFKKRRDIALGIAISGIGVGTLVAAPLAAYLAKRYDWRTAFEVFGWASMAILLGCAALLSRPPVLRSKGTANVPAMMRTRTFARLYLSLVFCGIVVYISFVFVTVYAMDIGASHLAGSALIGYIGAASVVGRLGLDGFAPRFGLLAVYKASYGILLVSCGVWLASHNYTMMIVFAVIMGVAYGGIAAMTPAVAAARFGIEGLGELLGLLMTSWGVACLVGPPLAGWLVDVTHDYRWPVFLATGAAVLALVVVTPLDTSVVEAGTDAEIATAD